jgi:hypothetical protein
MDTMLSKALREFTTGPLNQLIVNLGGQDGDQWEQQLKQFLRKEPCWTNGQVTQVAEPKPTPSILELAREIMGTNFFGIEEAIKYFGVNATKQQLAYLTEVPFSEEVLKSCKDTHVLVAMFPLSILDIRGIAKKQSDRTLFYSQDWYDKQAFAKDKGEVGWQLVRKEPIANSTSKTWNDQQALLSKDEETPTARIVVYTMVGHFLATGERLFEKIYVRCVDLDSVGFRVLVGSFDAEGLYVYDWMDDDRGDSIGVSAARKQS